MKMDKDKTISELVEERDHYRNVAKKQSEAAEEHEQKGDVYALRPRGGEAARTERAFAMVCRENAAAFAQRADRKQKKIDDREGVTT